MYVFVYGTLKKHGSNNGILRASVFVTAATVRGHELYNSGFPVANVNPATCITGEVWDIGNPVEDTMSSRTLWNLDSLEGYDENNLDHSMYHRVNVDAHGDDGVVYQAGMYLGNAKFWRDFKGMRPCPYDTTSNSYTWSRETRDW